MNTMTRESAWERFLRVYPASRFERTLVYDDERLRIIDGDARREAWERFRAELERDGWRVIDNG